MAIDIDEIGRGEEVRRQLRHFIYDKVVSIPHEGTIVHVEELFPWML